MFVSTDKHEYCGIPFIKVGSLEIKCLSTEHSVLCLTLIFTFLSDLVIIAHVKTFSLSCRK